MCFSPEISFAASVVIGTIGIMTLRKVTFREQLLFASIPLLFASQQFVEGLLWLVLLKGGMPEQQHWLTQIFNGYADIIWPVIAPLSIHMIEKEDNRKNLIKALVFLGAGVAFYSIRALTNVGMSSEIVNYCIKYTYPMPQPEFTRWIYIIVTCLPFLISSQTFIQWIGLLNIITFYIAYSAYKFAYISVWCFFAAITSACIYLYFNELQKQKQTFFGRMYQRIMEAYV